MPYTRKKTTKPILRRSMGKAGEASSKRKGVRKDIDVGDTMHPSCQEKALKGQVVDEDERGRAFFFT